MYKFLFTTLPSNDLGLLTRSLPLAKELNELGQKIAFSSPAKAPDRLIKDAGFENLTPEHPLYHIKNFSFRSITDLLKSKKHKDKYGNIFNFLFKLLRAIPRRFAPATAEIWIEFRSEQRPLNKTFQGDRRVISSKILLI